MLLNHIILAILWVGYGVLHSVLASIAVKNRLAKQLGSSFRYYRLIYTVFAFVSLAGILAFLIAMKSWQVYPSSILSYILGGLVSISGLAIMMICIKKYFMSLSGILSLFQERPSSNLIITGVHRYIRHPLYAGTFLFIWGLFILFPSVSLLITDTIITIYTLIGIRLEENKLVSEFGDQYTHYQATVPRIIPSFKVKRTV